MKTYTINQLLSENTWTICCNPGAIIHKLFFSGEIVTYRKDDIDGIYAKDRIFPSLSNEGIEALKTMLAAHNNTPKYQAEAEKFNPFTMTK